MRLTFIFSLVVSSLMIAQEPPPPGGGRGGEPGRGGMGFGPPTADREVVKEYDKNNNGRLEDAERSRAREALEKEPRRGRGGPGGFGGPGGRGAANPKPGPALKPAKVAQYPDKELFDVSILRTLFFEFKAPDWEKELMTFYGTDVEVPAKLTVDGQTYDSVGVSFRGASSYMGAGEGRAKSMNVSMDYLKKDQRLMGVHTLNLLNCNGDASRMSTVLYSAFAQGRVPAPKANLVEVVINGESWGIFCAAEQFNRDFLKQRFGNSDGARWKVKGRPGGDSGLSFKGEDLAAYKQRYQIRSKDNAEDWTALRELCRTLSTTPLEELEAKLQPIFDIESALWFLALDVVLSNSDGYWTRASDYSLWRDAKGVFHVIPHDMNEAFSSGGGGGPRGGPRGEPPVGPRGETGSGDPGRGQPGADVSGRSQPGADVSGRSQPGAAAPGRGRAGGFGGGGGPTLDPLVALEDEGKPLRSRLLKVPALREKYLAHVKELATLELEPQAFAARIQGLRELIEGRIAVETRGLSDHAGFLAATAAPGVTATAPEGGEPRMRSRMSLNTFAQKRREFLLQWTPKNVSTESSPPPPDK
jgi:spore coat protein CotH